MEQNTNNNNNSSTRKHARLNSPFSLRRKVNERSSGRKSRFLRRSYNKKPTTTAVDQYAIIECDE